jgi:hypothetical protein
MTSDLRTTSFVLAVTFLRIGVAAGAEPYSPLVEWMRVDEQRIERMFTRFKCRHVYLDVGSNIGVQIRKLYEPHKYPGAPVHSLFDRTFGRGNRCDVCSIGFEPNPRHRTRISRLERELTAAGAGVVMFETAAGSMDGVLPLTMSEHKSKYEDMGASTLNIGRYKGRTKVAVRMIHVGRIIETIRRLQLAVPGNSMLLMKLDIEGAEWTALPELMLSRTLCAVDCAFIEYHVQDFERMQTGRRQNEVQRAAYRTLRSATMQLRAELRALLNGSSAECPATITDMDDETWALDGQPWPTGSLCPHPQNTRVMRHFDTQQVISQPDTGRMGRAARRIQHTTMLPKRHRAHHQPQHTQAHNRNSSYIHAWLSHIRMLGSMVGG